MKQWTTKPDWFEIIVYFLLLAMLFSIIFLMILSSGKKRVKEYSVPTPQDFQNNHKIIYWDSPEQFFEAQEDKWKHKKPQTTGKASWYDYSLKGYPNYSKDHYTAASRDYLKGTMLRVCRIEINVTELESGSWQSWPCVDVRVNDYVKEPNVIIDLSSAAFQKLAPLSRGIIDVEIIEL